MLFRAIFLVNWGLLVSLACAAEPPRHGPNILLSRDPQKLFNDHNRVSIPNRSQPVLGDPVGLPVPMASFADHNSSSTTGASHIYGDPPFTVTATSNSPGVITYSIITGNAAVTPTGRVTLTGTGQVTIEASQSATADYASTTATLTFVVNSATPTIVFTGQNQISNSDFYVSATSNSTGLFTYSVVSGSATIAGNRVTPMGSGTILIQASEAADPNYTAASKEADFTIASAVLTVKANSCSRAFGAVNPLFTGSIAGNNTADLFTETFSTTANVASTPGQYALIPAASGQNLSKYAINIEPGTVTITQAPTLTTLGSTSTTVDPGGSVVLTAQVSSLTSGVPGGTVTFFDNGATLQTISVAGGTASLTTTLSPGITHLITGSSSGDANFLGGSTATGLSVTVAQPDFSFVSVGPGTQTVLPGTSTTFGFNLSPLHGSVDSPIVFSVTGVPSDATVSFTPSKLEAGSGPASVQLIIQTAAQTAHQNGLPSIPRDTRALLTALTVMAFWSRKRLSRWNKHMRLLSLLVAGIGSSLWLTGCGAGILQKTPQTYNLVVVATSGTVQHSQPLTLLIE